MSGATTTAPASASSAIPAAAASGGAPPAYFAPPPPVNEPVLTFAPGTAPRDALKAALDRLGGEHIEIPLVIGDHVVETGDVVEMRTPHNHEHRLGRWHAASRDHAARAVEQAKAVAPEWAAMSWQDRAAIFLKAADLLAGPYRATMNAATMLCQSKTAHQAEIDAACEMVDFLRFNVHFMTQIYQQQPLSAPGTWNRLEFRPLEGFVLAVTPFNFASIAGNLPMAPALMGNVVLWKPASSAVYTAWHIMKLWEMAGLPPGVITLLPGAGGSVADPLLEHPDLAGVHFTGSTAVFQHIWRKIGQDVGRYRTYPRVVGETGGKDFVVAHASADAAEVATALVRGAFEYQGQKCSAVSRAYVPDTLWPRVEEHMRAQIDQIIVGDVGDFRNFMGAVIDREAFARIRGYVDYARQGGSNQVVVRHMVDDSQGFFIGPHVVRTSDPHDRLMREEIFGPLLTVFVYPHDDFEQALALCDQTSPYGLTGAIFARDRRAIARATQALTHAAGNFYVNDKPTGAVVGQQPFGGARASGTNDKAGSVLNLLRWVSPRAIKETFVPPTDFRYPFMEEA